MKVLKIVGLEALLIGIGGSFYITRVEPADIELTELSLALPGLGKGFSGFRVAQVSDVHFGGWMNAERLNSALALALEQKPDVMVLTGDLVMGYPWAEVLTTLGELGPILSDLSKKLPVYSIMGNHDHWGNVDVVRDLYRDNGILELRNSVTTLERGGDVLYLAGVDDVRERHDDLERVLKLLPEQGPAILLAHEPDFALESSATGRFSLQLSGHSHGGQVVFPFVGPLVLPYMGRRFPAGLYRVGEMYQYTNRGIGMTPPNIRFNCKPEITLFTFESA